MIRANTQNFTFAQLADLRNVFSGLCATPNSAAVVNAFKSNLDIRNVVEVRDGFPTLVAALEHIGPEV